MMKEDVALWCDLETTGLVEDPGAEILEVAFAAVKVPELKILSTFHRVLPFKIENHKDIKIHDKVMRMHEDSGLWRACRESSTTAYDVAREAQKFIVENGCQGSVLCGAKPDFDRAFLKRRVNFSEVEKLLHYRNFDTNSFFIFQSWIEGLEPQRQKGCRHRAMDDILDSINAVEEFCGFFEKMVKSWGEEPAT